MPSVHKKIFLAVSNEKNSGRFKSYGRTSRRVDKIFDVIAACQTQNLERKGYVVVK